MRAHVHNFRIHIGLRVFGGKSRAWLPVARVLGHIHDEPVMWRCTECGEQGYEIRGVTE